MQRLTRKQFNKRQTLAIMKQILMDLLPEEEQNLVTDKVFINSFLRYPIINHQNQVLLK